MKLHRFLIPWFVITLYCTPLAPAQQSSPHLLTLFFKPALKQYCEGHACDVLEHAHIPGYINRTLLNHALFSKIVSGLYVTHAGLVDHSDYNGQVSFPLIHPEDHYTVVVTDSIKPVLLFANTVDHFELADDTHAEMYTFTKTNADKNKQPTWTVQKVDHAEHAIPGDAIVIFSQPAHIIIAEGTYPAEEGENAIFPHIYVTDTTPLANNSLQFVKIAKFFAPVQRAFAYAPERYAALIAN